MFKQSCLVYTPNRLTIHHGNHTYHDGQCGGSQMHNTSRLVLAVLLPMLVWTGTLGAQTTSGVISGRVVDPGGLGIPGAALTLSNDATREERQAVSVETGDFVFPAVLPGRYTV